MTQVHVETLGCFPMDATVGTLAATAEANAAAINAYLGGGGGGVSSLAAALILPRPRLADRRHD
jgi:hypothetical protein